MEDADLEHAVVYSLVSLYIGDDERHPGGSSTWAQTEPEICWKSFSSSGTTVQNLLFTR